MKVNSKLIALYLPQYHPTPRNDKWWGKGFTEWTNVGKANKLFPGHVQPHVPADLGYYDLRLPEVRKAQAEMAKEYGIYGFCYYHYWFEKGFEELEHPFDEVVRLGEPDFPFCLCWANETWYSKFWNMDGTISKNTLAEQKYLGKEDNEEHFYRLLPAFKDKRYIKKDGRIVFFIYKPFEFIGWQEFAEQWNKLAKDNGLVGFYFIAYSFTISNDYEKLKSLGYDEVVSCRLYQMRSCEGYLSWLYHKFLRVVLKYPIIKNYAKYYKDLVGEEERLIDVIPTIIPNWDHTPRSKRGGIVCTNTTPKNFEKHLNHVIETIKQKDTEENFCILISWNEWGEGNYVEPDLKYGKGFLEVIGKYFKS